MFLISWYVFLLGLWPDIAETSRFFMCFSFLQEALVNATQDLFGGMFWRSPL